MAPDRRGLAREPGAEAWLTPAGRRWPARRPTRRDTRDGRLHRALSPVFQRGLGEEIVSQFAQLDGQRPHRGDVHPILGAGRSESPWRRLSARSSRPARRRPAAAGTCARQADAASSWPPHRLSAPRARASAPGSVARLRVQLRPFCARHPTTWTSAKSRLPVWPGILMPGEVGDAELVHPVGVAVQIFNRCATTSTYSASESDRRRVARHRGLDRREDRLQGGVGKRLA